MTGDPTVFRDLTLVFLAALVGGALAWVTRQPLVLGYVFGGILISPLTPGLAVSRMETFEVFAEVGLVLLMFSIGIEFSLRDLLRVRWIAILGAPLGIALSVLLGLGTGGLLGWSVPQGLVVGAVISVASTMVLVRLLIDRGELRTPHGRVMIGVTLMEDLAVVLLTVLLPEMNVIGAMEFGGIGILLAKVLLLLGPAAYLAARIAPSLLLRAARTRNDELFLLVALAIALGTASLAQAVGLSLALGAFLAGFVISESEYAQETLARLLPLRDAFVALFFVTLGALIDPEILMANRGLLVVMVVLIVAGKAVIWTGVALLFRSPLHTALRVGLGLTQIGEFSFVIVEIARRSGYVGPEIYNATLAASLITILLNALLFTPASRAAGLLERKRDTASGGPAWPADEALRGHVVLCGFGRVGSAVGLALDAFGIPYAVIESDPEIVRALCSRGLCAIYGDASQARVLQAAHVGGALMVLVTIPETDKARLAICRIRQLHPQVPVLARAHDASAGPALRSAGADVVVQHELEGALTLTRHALGRLSLPTASVFGYLRHVRAASGLGGEGIAADPELVSTREVVLPPGSTLADLPLRSLRLTERLGIAVLAITRVNGDVVLNPSAETRLREGDRVQVAGLAARLEAFAAEARLTA